MSRSMPCAATAWRYVARLADDGRPPFCASGLNLHDRLTQVADSLARVAEKRGAFTRPCTNSTAYLHAS
jgi:hypothetical protein